MGSHQLGDEEVAYRSDAHEEALGTRMDRDDEDSTANLEHEVHPLLVSATQSSDEHRGMNVVEEHNEAIAQSSFAFHCQERQPRELDGRLQA